ncbi:MAG: hypothetical protein Q4E31_09540 [Intestinibacter bartlettii]|uniref:hypothetical protein n=1 Tax=Intestinibacter bartlettii TaxID=261299 RepID=UPI0026EE2C22|nr:hypothetical protein [Intestinibacter bartlettii]MDO5011055.1 hypothetical protein [Intestinibacter bartlettii]
MKKLLIVFLSCIMIGGGLIGCDKLQGKTSNVKNNANKNQQQQQQQSSTSQTKQESDSELFKDSMKEGKLALAEGEYYVARDMFKLALEEKSDDEASKLKEQCDMLCEIDDISSAYYFTTDEELTDDEIASAIKDCEKIVELCDKIMAIDSKSDAAKSEAKRLKEYYQVPDSYYESDSDSEEY